MCLISHSAYIIINGINGLLYKEGDMIDFLRVMKDVMERKVVFDRGTLPETVSKFSKEFVIEKIYRFLKTIKEEPS